MLQPAVTRTFDMMRWMFPLLHQKQTSKKFYFWEIVSVWQSYESTQKNPNDSDKHKWKWQMEDTYDGEESMQEPKWHGADRGS